MSCSEGAGCTSPQLCMDPENPLLVWGDCLLMPHPIVGSVAGFTVQVCLFPLSHLFCPEEIRNYKIPNAAAWIGQVVRKKE